MKELSLNQLEIKLNHLVTNTSKTWPSPIARRMPSLLEEEIGNKVIGIVAFLDSLSAFLGAILISIYVNKYYKDFPCEKFNKEIFEKFLTKPPTLGEWISVLREGLKYFADKTDFFIPELQKFSTGITDILKVNKNLVKIVKMEDKDYGLLDDLNSFRLSEGHPKKLAEYLKKHNIPYEARETKIHEGYKLALPIIVPNLIRLINGLNFFSNYWLFYIKSIREEENEKFAYVNLYSSEYPHFDEVNITDSYKEILKDEDFEPDLFRYKLFLAKVKQTDDLLSFSTYTEKTLEVNPILINWLRDKEFLPHQFEEWKNKKKKRILMGEIIYQKPKQEIEHYDTRNRLWNIYIDLKNKLNIPLEKDVEIAEEKKNFCIKLSYSHQRYLLVRKEIYPDLNIADEILSGIGFEKKFKEKIFDLQVTISQEDNENKAIQSKVNSISLQAAIKKLWTNPERWNCLLNGEGGMGKTTSLLKLWESFLSNKSQSPIPIFIQLESYNHVKPERRRNFIWHTISKEYLGCIPSEEQIKDLENQFINKTVINNQSCPSVLLLLDGFNEVTENNNELLECINEISHLNGVQIIISSRSNKPLISLQFEELILHKLEDKQIKNFMKERNIEFKAELLRDIPLLRNPMMLTLYCGTEREMKENSGKDDYDFIENPSYKAEILHNFIESSIARHDRQTILPANKVLTRLYLRHIFPRIGYYMWEKSLFEISHKDLLNLIKEELERYSSDNFRDSHCDIDNIIPEIKDYIANNRNNIIKIIHNLIQIYCLIRESTKDNYTFIHQEFRDYFSASYIREKIKEGISLNNYTFIELSEYVLEPNLRRMLGELLLEPKRKPVIKNGFQKGEVKETLLDKVLNHIKGQKIGRGDRLLLNIMEILKDKRIDLSDTDLSGLELRDIVLNNVMLGHGKVNGKYEGANLRGSKVKISNFFPPWHYGQVNFVIYSPDGEKIVSAGEDKTIKEWNSFTGECIRTYEGHSDGITSVKYSPCGEKIISVSKDETIKEWDVNTGKCLKTYEGHFDTVTSVAYSPNGKKIISGSLDRTVNEWDIEEGYCLWVYEGHSGGVTSVNYSPDGNKIVSGSQDNTIKEWNVNTKECIRTYIGHLNAVTSINYNPDGDKIISGSVDNTIKEWDVNTGKCIRTYTGHSDVVSYVSYSPDGEKIISSAGSNSYMDTTIKEWDVNTGKCIRTYEGHLYGVNSVNYGPYGRRIVSASNDYTIKQWNVISGECIGTYKSHFETITSIKYSPDKKRIISGSKPGTIKEWDSKTKECIKIYKLNSDSDVLAVYSLDGKEIISLTTDGVINIFNIGTGECIKEYKNDSKSFIYYNPDKERIISVLNDGTINEWDSKSLKNIKTYKGHSKKVSSVSYNPYCNRMLSAAGNIIKEWDVKTGECIKTYELINFIIIVTDKLNDSINHEKMKIIENIKNIRYSEDELTGKLIKLTFDRQEIEVIKNQAIKEPYNISSISYNSKGDKFLLISDKKVEEWDLTGKHIQRYDHDYSVSSAIYSMDDSKILSSHYNLIEEWDVFSGEPIRRYEDHNNEVTSISYSPDGEEIISGGKDNKIKEWDVKTGECLKTIQNIFALFIQGVKFSSDLEASEEEKLILKQYGAIF